MRPPHMVRYQAALRVHLKATTVGSVTRDLKPYCNVALWFGDNSRLTDDLSLVTCKTCLRIVRAEDLTFTQQTC